MYLLPTDNEELERLHVMHNILKWAWDANYNAPILKDTMSRARVLDVGCGDGTWVLEMAREFPRASFYGIDICIHHPPAENPGNVQFQLVNILDGLPFQDETFDFVHMRMMMYAVKTEEWNEIVSELYRVCKKGAWIQLSEQDLYPIGQGPASEKFTHLASNALVARDFNPFVARVLDQLLDNSQFVNTKQIYTSIPCGKWGKRFGELFQEETIALYRAFKPWMAKTMNISHQEFDELLLAMSAELDTYNAYHNWYIAYGRKPYVINDDDVASQSRMAMAPHYDFTHTTYAEAV